jgi:glucans biosynthesis protein C
MSLFFMISGYFMVASYERHGPRPFLRGRLQRLGPPLLFFFLLVIPLQQYLAHLRTGDLGPLTFWRYYADIYFGFGKQPAGWSGPAWPELNFGHLWYVEHLLLFSLVYAGLRAVQNHPPAARRSEPPPVTHRVILLFALTVAVATGIVRIWYPIDRWVGLLGIIQVAFADLPRDLGFFIVGALAYHRRWFLEFPNRIGWAWLLVGIAASAVWTVYALGLWSVLPVGDVAMGILYPIWEAVLCCGMCIGLPVLFRERFNIQGRWGKTLARSQYAAYLFHVPVVLLFQYTATGVEWPPLVKFILVTIVSVPVTFLFSQWILRFEFVRRIL